jgi:polysaccharide biosynthesis transport protein
VSLTRRYGLWVVFTTLVCVAGAWLIGGHKQAAYTASAEVDVEASAIPNTVAATVNMATEKDVALSGQVLAQAAPLAGLTADQMAAHVSVAVPAGANLLSIGCTMPRPAQAQRCAQAATQAYMDFRNQTASPPKVRARDPLTVTLVTAAQVPSKPSGLSSKVLLSVGAFVGLLLGLGTAFLGDRVDDRVRDREDLERCLDAAVIGSVPRVRRSAGPASVFSTAPDSAAAEAYRYLRAHLDSLLARSADGRPADGGKVVLVTGAQPREGRTCIASNLAAAMAQAGHQVLLVDADLHHPSLAGVFQAGDRPGLTEMLAGRAALGDVAVPAGLPGLQLITVGEEDRPAELFDAARLARVLKRLRAAADVIIVDSGPVLSVSDPIALAAASDLVLMVANIRRSRRAAIRVAAQELRTAGTVTVVGVLTGLPRPLLRSRPRPALAAEPQPSPRARALPPSPRTEPTTGISLIRPPDTSHHGHDDHGHDPDDHADAAGNGQRRYPVSSHRVGSTAVAGQFRPPSHRLPASADDNRL